MCISNATKYSPYLAIPASFANIFPPHSLQLIKAPLFCRSSVITSSKVPQFDISLKVCPKQLVLDTLPKSANSS